MTLPWFLGNLLMAQRRLWRATLSCMHPGRPGLQESGRSYTEKVYMIDPTRGGRNSSRSMLLVKSSLETFIRKSTRGRHDVNWKIGDGVCDLALPPAKWLSCFPLQVSGRNGLRTSAAEAKWARNLFSQSLTAGEGHTACAQPIGSSQRGRHKELWVSF